jgi:hypothetical protein
MKTEISLPEDLVEAVHQLAARLGISPGELYLIAVAEYLAEHSDVEGYARLDDDQAALAADRPAGQPPAPRQWEW